MPKGSPVASDQGRGIPSADLLLGAYHYRPGFHSWTYFHFLAHYSLEYRLHLLVDPSPCLATPYHPKFVNLVQAYHTCSQALPNHYPHETAAVLLQPAPTAGGDGGVMKGWRTALSSHHAALACDTSWRYDMVSVPDYRVSVGMGAGRRNECSPYTLAYSAQISLRIETRYETGC